MTKALFPASGRDKTTSGTLNMAMPWKADIYWKTSDPMGVMWTFENDHYLVSWPDDTYRLVIADNPAKPGLKWAIPTNYTAKVLGYKYVTSYGTNVPEIGGMPFYGSINTECYAVPHPDGLTACGPESSIWFRYACSGVPAAVRFSSKDHKAVSIGVPLECLELDVDRDRVLRESFEFFGLYGSADGPGSYQFGFLYFTPANLKSYCQASVMSGDAV